MPIARLVIPKKYCTFDQVVPIYSIEQCAQDSLMILLYTTFLSLFIFVIWVFFLLKIIRQNHIRKRD